MAGRWEVVGGVDKGGIVVREGDSLQSAWVEPRLRVGAIVEELERKGDRMRFRKLSGEGPTTGWVSQKTKDQVLLSEVKDELPEGEWTEWTVVHTGPVNVRERKDLRSHAIGQKTQGTVLRGNEQGEWLKLADEPGFVLINSDFYPVLMLTSEAPDEYKRIPVGDIFNMLEAELKAGKPKAPEVKTAARGGSLKVKVPTLEFKAPLRVPTAAAAAETAGAAGSAGSGGNGNGAYMTVSLTEGESGTGEAGLSQDAKNWLAKARKWLQLLDPKATVPPTSRLPEAALRWEPSAAVLYVITHGQFDPQRDVPSVGLQAPARPDLVSVCCATSDRRRSFHQIIYKNFVAQTYEPKELVVIHTGELPSEFFQQTAREDQRVIYRFFPVTREAPGSPRLTDEQMGNPWDAVLVDDDRSELTMWDTGDPWKWEIEREGWTKGLKRNVAASVAQGTVIAHFDDGCLYAADYLQKMLAELRIVPSGAGGAAVALSRWYVLSIADQDFRLVDLKQPDPYWEMHGHQAMSGQTQDQWNHGFNYVYHRAIWETHPFPDIETVGTKDSDFMKGLQKAGVPVKCVEPKSAEALAACGWHRDATCGAKDAPANINHSQVLNFMMFRGKEVNVPRIFSKLLPAIKEVASELLARRERYLRDLVDEHGSVYVCSYCNFAVGLAKNIGDTERRVTNNMQITDGYELMIYFEKTQMKFDVCEFSSAGGACAEGKWQKTPPGHGWLQNQVQRMAICRNCGWQLGWRYEPSEYYDNFAGTPKEKADLLPPAEGQVTWAFIWRHLRERKRPNEYIPSEKDEGPRHSETALNKNRNDVSPWGTKLREFCTGQGNGGALPLFYICDICDKPARGSEHMWGCGTNDYDICDACKNRRR